MATSRTKLRSSSSANCWQTEKVVVLSSALSGVASGCVCACWLWPSVVSVVLYRNVNTMVVLTDDEDKQCRLVAVRRIGTAGVEVSGSCNEPRPQLSYRREREKQRAAWRRGSMARASSMPRLRVSVWFHYVEQCELATDRWQELKNVVRVRHYACELCWKLTLKWNKGHRRECVAVLAAMSIIKPNLKFCMLLWDLRFCRWWRCLVQFSGLWRCYEDGCRTLLRKSGKHLQDYMAS